MNVCTSCQCGWVGIAPTYAASTADHLFHQLSKGEGHSAINHTNVPERMAHPDLSILRQVASQDALDYRALHMVKGREEFRLRRAGDMMAPLFTEETQGDGLGAIVLMLGALIITIVGAASYAYIHFAK